MMSCLLSKEDLQKLKENKDVKFIYKLPCSFWEEKFEYIIIGDLDTKEDNNIRYFSLDDWFLLMKLGSLLPYVCSTLNKSGKIKEFINIYEKPDIIKFRKYILDKFSHLSNIYKDQNDYIERIISQELLWGIQIIKEGRVNRVDVFKEKYTNPLKEFIQLSDPIYKMKVKNEQCK